MIDGHFNWGEDFTKVFESWSVWIAIASAIILGIVRLGKKLKFKTEEFIQIHGEIHELLTELRVLTDSARSQVIQFHNGEYFMDGISMRKFSLTHESVEKGVQSDGERIKGYLCSMFLPLLQNVTENNPKIRYTVDLQQSYVKQYLEARNVEAFCVLPIRINNVITGFVLVQWCNAVKAETVNQEEVSNYIKKATNSITVQLSLQKK